MTEDNPKRDREISHFTITPDAYNELVRTLGETAYKYAAVPLQILTEGSRVIFKPEIPDKEAATITDKPNPDEEAEIDAVPDKERGHELVFDDVCDGYQCTRCGLTFGRNEEPGTDCPGPKLDNNQEGEE